MEPRSCWRYRGKPGMAISMFPWHHLVGPARPCSSKPLVCDGNSPARFLRCAYGCSVSGAQIHSHRSPWSDTDVAKSSEELCHKALSQCVPLFSRFQKDGAQVRSSVLQARPLADWVSLSVNTEPKLYLVLCADTKEMELWCWECINWAPASMSSINKTCFYSMCDWH